ncbi:MAG: helix-turn-helix domain-containing protein [Solirubrobacteraceae bacterium]
MNSARLSRTSFGAAVHALRLERNFSQDALASAAQLPSRSLLAPIEAGTLAVRLPTVLRIADALDVSAAELIRRAERVHAQMGGGD